ncbi:MAG: N-acetylmuramoyl-L-alanine amidase [Cellulosilyticaceae bacterium]
MNRKLMTTIVSLGIFCMSFSRVYAAPMELVYDGKTHYYNLPPITMYINGEEVDTNLMPPVQIENTTLVPVREIFEPMGAFVEWKAEEKRVYIDYNNTLLILEMDNKEAWKNGEVLTLDVPAKVINNKIMVPVRFISEQIGFEVKWVGDTREIFITEDKLITPPEVVEPTPEPEEPVYPEEDLKDEKADLSELMMKLDGIDKIYEGIRNKHSVYMRAKDYSKSTIEAVSITNSGEGAIAIIQASSPLTSFESTISEGKIIVDILNSNNALKSSITPNTNRYVGKVRTSQYTKDTTRVVFDLISGAKTKVSLSPDRMSILVEMEKQPLEGVIVGKDKISDYIAIENIGIAQINIKQNPGQVILNIDNIYSDEEINWSNLRGDSIESLEVRNTSTGVQIEAVLKGRETYSVQTSEDRGDAIIRIVKPNYENIEYSSYDRTLTLVGAPGLSARKIYVNDQYRERKIILDLGADYSDHFGNGSFPIGDQVIKDVQIVTEGTTKLIINESSIHAVNIKDSGDDVKIQFVKPNEKYDKVLVLDSGHGGNDGGTSGNGLKEKDINLKQTMAIKNLIESNTDIKVYLTREVDTTLTLAFRTDLANEINADMFVSVHNNSASSAVKGTEVLYYPSSSDSRSKQIAQLMQKKIIEATGMNNRGIKERPDLYVLRTSKMPAVLIEGGFLSNAEDAARLASEEFTQAFAYAVYESIVESFYTLDF